MLDKDLHIWVGRFESKKRLDSYMKECYGDDDDETPISEFARDQREWFYDHDFVCAVYFRKATMQQLIEVWRLPEPTVARAVAAINKLGVSRANVSFIAGKGEFDSPRSAKGNGYQLWYVGLFDARPISKVSRYPDDHTTPVNHCYVVADGKFGLTTSRDGEMRLWDLKSGKLIDARKHPGTILEKTNNRVALLCSSPNRKEFLTYMTGLAWWQPSSRGLKLLRKLPAGHVAGISNGVIDPSTRRLITSSFDNNLAVRDLKNGRPKLLKGHESSVYGLALLPNGRVLSQDDQGGFRIWDLKSAATVASFSIPGIPRVSSRRLFATKDGKKAVVCTYNDQLLVINLETGKLIKDLYKRFSASLDEMMVTSDERMVVGVSSDNKNSPVRVWDLRSGKLLHTMLGHQGETMGMALSEDSRRAVTVSCDANVILWNLQTGKEISRFRDAPIDRAVAPFYEPDEYVLNSVAISPAGDVIIAGEYSGRVRILKLEKQTLTPLR